MTKLPHGVIIGAIFGVLIMYFFHVTGWVHLLPVASLPDGAVYRGEMRNNLFHGEGSLEWPNGDQYKGEFVDGLFHGTGVMTWSNGVIYRGDFNGGEFTGIATISYVDGREYSGEVLQVQPHGKGILKSEYGTYEGEFKNNHYEGPGKFVDSSGNEYTGEFKGGKYHGEGLYIATDGRRYEGQFEAGQLTGKGTYVNKAGVRYRGEFKDWLYDGEGEFTSTGGDIYRGEFKYGYYHGKGELVYAELQDDVSQVTGVWKRGRLIESDQPGLAIDIKANNEAVLYNQQALLEETWKKLEPNDPDKIDLYFLGIAGDGSQAVFRREIQFVHEHFDQALGTEGKSMSLINARNTISRIPLATKTSIKQSLKEIASRMDLERDILFLYLTSHGSRRFDFSLKQDGFELPDISAKALKAIFDELSIQWKVIVVSACYSGGFIEALQDDTSLIITAAARDRESFGCSNEANFTYFGEAYFKDALALTNDFVEAFDIAQDIVQKREAEGDYKHSSPQIYQTDVVVEQLQKWRDESLPNS